MSPEEKKPEAEREASSSSAEESAAGGAGAPPAGAEERKEYPPVGSAEEKTQIKMSAEMEAALAEAESFYTEKEGAPAGARESKAPGGGFDPNVVEPEDRTPIKPPDPRELELRLQILDLRQALRDKEQELEKKIQELRQNADQVRLLQKRFDDYKARVMKEKADWFNYGHEPLLKEMLQVADNLERAVSHAQKDVDPAALLEGVSLILRQFQAVLTKFGVTPVAAAGEPFNPEWHQAMAQVVDETVPADIVLQVHQKGYKLKDRLLRPAMVVVSAGPAAGKTAAAKEELAHDGGDKPGGGEKVPGPPDKEKDAGKDGGKSRPE